MYSCRPTQPYNFQADLIWCDGTFKLKVLRNASNALSVNFKKYLKLLKRIVCSWYVFLCTWYVHADCNVSFSMVQTTPTIAVPPGNPFGFLTFSREDHRQCEEFVQFIEGKSSNICLVQLCREGFIFLPCNN
jgi:hypothetical protein